MAGPVPEDDLLNKGLILGYRIIPSTTKIRITVIDTLINFLEFNAIEFLLNNLNAGKMFKR
jgi:hypothetical protein